MGATAQFNFTNFAARYPAFSTLDPALAAQYFTEAGFYLANDGTGPVQDLGQQTLLLYMLTAHIAQLNAVAVNGAGQTELVNGFVGRVGSASEGSVSVSLQPFGSTTSDLAQWLNQTPYGAAFWAATVRYRTMHYRPLAGRNFGPLVRPVGYY